MLYLKSFAMQEIFFSWNLKVWNRRNRLSPEAVENTMLIYENDRIQNEDDDEDYKNESEDE